MRGKPIKPAPYRVGGAIQVGISENFKTTWYQATVTSLLPMQVQLEDGRHISKTDQPFLMKPAEGNQEAKALTNLPPEVEVPILRKALAEILITANTKHPNSTVQRIIHIAKEALGEMDS